MNIGFISLGCSKNLIDTEMAIGLFKKNGFSIVNKPEKADILVINTCGFIASAKEEAIHTILEMAQYKKKRCKILIVMGCLVQRYQTELKKLIPEVDSWIAIEEYPHFWEKVNKIIEEKLDPKQEELVTSSKQLEYRTREITTGNRMAYLKIAEGCNNHCTYCAIPFIRGPYHSRKKEDILEEAKSLAEKGIKELIIIAQDTTKYGIDLYGKPLLAELLDQLCKIKQIKWIRFLYAYPESIDDSLIEVIKRQDKICPYFDIPLQHISDSVLKRMNRKSDEQSIRNLIRKIRLHIPEAVLRTTFIVGFPGETKEDFEKLYHFVKEVKFDRLGVFAYSREEGTPAAKLKEQIHPMTKKSRYQKIMELQSQIVQEKQQEQIGKRLEVLIEAESKDHHYYITRSKREAPEIDGVIYVKKEQQNTCIGSFIPIQITGFEGYDLMAKQVL